MSCRGCSYLVVNIIATCERSNGTIVRQSALTASIGLRGKWAADVYNGLHKNIGSILSCEYFVSCTTDNASVMASLKRTLVGVMTMHFILRHRMFLSYSDSCLGQEGKRTCTNKHCPNPGRQIWRIMG